MALPRPGRSSPISKWKVPIPAIGHSSPILWGNHIFLTGQPNRIFAFDACSGKLLWDKVLDIAPAEPPSADEPPWQPGEYGTAVPTPCTDGECVYAFFGDGVVGCLDFEGKQVWSKRIITRPQSSYGLASSPILYRDLLIIQVDQKPDESFEPTKDRSFIVALHTADGSQAWRTPRPVRDSWSTPIIVRQDRRDILLTTAAPLAIAYEPATGGELWRVNGLSGDVAASPVWAEGMLYASGDESGKLLAIRCGGIGESVKNHEIAWTYDRNMPAAVSPVCDGKLLFQTSAAGTVVALDVRDGSEKWSRPLDTCFASPILAGGKLLLIDEEGIIHILRAADGTVLQALPLGEKVTASPALLGRRLYVRTAKHLLCMEGS
jgi:outer membrane protein assembly factor BamB